MKTVQAKIGDETLDCGIFYKLLVYHQSAWKSWSRLTEDLTLESSIEFVGNTADFYAYITKADYDTHKADFTEAGEVAFKFKAVPIVSGSTVAGPTVDPATLTGAEFKIVFTEPTKAEKCAALTMSLADTFDGTTVRDFEHEFEIGVSNTLTINAKTIYPSVYENCSMKTVLEFFAKGEWHEVRNGNHGWVVETTSDIKKIDFSISQE
jgi:hypothetical protein